MRLWSVFERLRDEDSACMVEKPAPQDAPSNLAVIGRYILTPDIFGILRNTPPGRNGEVQLTGALQTQANDGRVIAYRFKGRRLDCGTSMASSRPPTIFTIAD
jgi:UTP-glucose-1-phosphate uridylyltransferase